MRLDINSLKIICNDSTVSKKDESTYAVDSSVNKSVRSTPSKILSALANNIAMTVKQLACVTGVSQPAIYKATTKLKSNGDIEKIHVPKTGGRGVHYFKLFGADACNIPAILYRKKDRVKQTNNKSGVTGVHFEKASKRWCVTFCKGKYQHFNNFLDAVCKRKSLELGV